MRPSRPLLHSILLGALILGACGQASVDQPDQAIDATGEGLRVAFVHNAEVDDEGWETSHDAARQYVVDQFPGIETTTVENTPSGDQAKATFEDLAGEGYDLIIGTTFYQDDVLDVAAHFPEVKFITWGGYQIADNVGHFDVALEDGRYLDGLVAGHMTETNRIGYVAAFPIEQVVRGLDAFTRGAREVNPEAVVTPVWTLNWFDPPKEREAADALADTGNDVIATATNAASVASVAQRRDLYHIGYGWDQSSRAPETWLSSFTFDWGPYYAQQIQAIIDGTWTAEVFYGGLPQDVIGLAPFGPAVPQDVIELVEGRADEIRAGEFDVLSGPLHDNEGNLVVEQGASIPLEDRVACCDWLIEGVEGSIES